MVSLVLNSLDLRSNCLYFKSYQELARRCNIDFSLQICSSFQMQKYLSHKMQQILKNKQHLAPGLFGSMLCRFTFTRYCTLKLRNLSAGLTTVIWLVVGGRLLFWSVVSFFTAIGRWFFRSVVPLVGSRWSVARLMATFHSTISDIPMGRVREDQRHRRRFTCQRWPAIPVMVIIPLNFASCTFLTHENR